MSAIPAQFTAGDRVEWQEVEAPVGTTAITAYLRTNAANGLMLLGTATADPLVWNFILSSAPSATMQPQGWKAQIVATVGADTYTVRTSAFTVLPSLAYSALPGALPGALDLRSQLEKDLQTVEDGIRALVGGAQEYYVGTGTGGRRVRRADLAELIKWRDRLRGEISAAKASELGLDRKVYVRFMPY
jgi:hypothetical protein